MTQPVRTIDNDEPHHALSEAEFRTRLVEIMPALRSFARRLCGNRDMVEDLAQETVMKAWAARDRFAGGTSFRAWTFTILRNHYFGQLRQNRPMRDVDEATLELAIGGREGDQETRLDAIDVLRAIDTLPLVQREMLILTAIGSVSYEDTARLWGITIGTVKSRIARARAALAATLAKGLMPGTRRSFPAVEEDVTDAFFARLKTLVHPKSAALSRRLAFAV